MRVSVSKLLPATSAESVYRALTHQVLYILPPFKKIEKNSLVYKQLAILTQTVKEHDGTRWWWVVFRRSSSSDEDVVLQRGGAARVLSPLADTRNIAPHQRIHT